MGRRGTETDFELFPPEPVAHDRIGVDDPGRHHVRTGLKSHGGDPVLEFSENAVDPSGSLGEH